MKQGEFRVINLDKQVYLKPDEYLNGWARHCGWKATLAFDSLCRHADRNRESFPSIELMAQEHGVSYNTVRRGIKDLEAWGIIIRKRKRSKSGKLLNNTYFILAKDYWKQPQPPQGYGTTTAPTGNHHSPHRAIKGTHIKDTHITPHKQAQKKFSSLKSLESNELIKEIASKYAVTEDFVLYVKDRLENWCLSKGRGYKNYKRALMNWVSEEKVKRLERRSNDSKKRGIDASGL